MTRSFIKFPLIPSLSLIIPSLLIRSLTPDPHRLPLLPDEFVANILNFREDALTCFQLNLPSGRCIPARGASIGGKLFSWLQQLNICIWTGTFPASTTFS